MNYLHEELVQLQKTQRVVFDFIQESSLGGLWYWDLHNPENRWISPKFWRTVGHDPEALPNVVERWQAVVNAEDLAALNAHVAHCTASSTKSYEQVVRCTHQSGAIVWLLCQGLLIQDEAGQPYRMLGVLTNFTKQRNEEIYAHELASHYGSILSNQSVYIIKTDAQGKYTYVNDFFYERFGYDSKIIGTSSLQSIVEEDWPKCIGVVGRCFAEPEIPHQVILRKPYRDGTVKSNHWEFKGLLDSAGQISEILCVGYDVTLLVENLERSQKLLEITKQQNNRLQNFAYIISHNIRSHSANLTSLVKLMQLSTDQAQSAMFLQMLKTSTDKLAETIVNLNEIVTANSHANQPKEPRNLREEVNKTLEALNILIHESSIAVSVDIPSIITVNVVPAYLDSILLNLISNAIKYRSTNTYPIIALGYYLEEGYTVLTIKDNGLGIDLNRHRTKLFGMYKTFHSNEDARGVGLFITKNQIEAMNGKIDVESELGSGSTFKVYFSESV
ncbi:PAS domain-containing sensor histidine kinase [Hymenobacter sp. GOD-10R]|uniref:PAS domain-containing sensor histidine kinase n=1 Tax=Hymenobacter sp. GOD-10R TaxID=3093922 RepID=UPI002D79711A|nr:PAS domain-containing protein [Hymenobacter sp. GOD-10R]WRQ27014.1 PAS domain-containing protein [Hymenobacter sp. GOD-10R]